MLLLSDVRQGIFYAMLCSFWLVFAGEHMLIQESGEKNSLKIYWRHLSAVVIGCISLFLFDICERGVQLRNPFYSIWVSRFGSKIAVSHGSIFFCIIASLSNSCLLFPLPHSTDDINRVGRNLGSCLLPVPVLYGVEGVQQHQHQTKCVTIDEQDASSPL